MKNIIAAIILTLSGISSGQIIITSQDIENFFAPGLIQTSYSSRELYGLDTMNIGFVSPIAQIWKCPQIFLSDTLVQNCITPESSGYHSQYPNATHAIRLDLSYLNYFKMEVFIFFSISPTELKSLGKVSHFTSTVQDTITYDFVENTIMKLPLSMGTTFVTYYDSTKMFGRWYVEEVTKSVDAHGTISIFGTDAKSLRLKTTTAYRVYENNNYLYGSFLRSYEWVAPPVGVVEADADSSSQTFGNVPLKFFMITTFSKSTGIHDIPLMANSFILYPNYPNPFNLSTTISFNIPDDQYVVLKVYDILGNEIANLVDEYMPGGVHNAIFDASKLSSGLYLCKLKAGNYSKTIKMMLLK